MDEEEVERKILDLEKRGYVFFVDSHSDNETPFYTPDRVKLPDGRILDEAEIDSGLRQNPYDPFLSTALSLMDLCFSEEYGDRRFDHFSFDGEEDIEECRRKYGAKSRSP